VEPADTSILSPHSKILITGVAGLVGQNLALLLRERGYRHVVGIDKHAYNLEVFRSQNPGYKAVHADLARRGDWETNFADVECLIQLHAQITGKDADVFVRNNVTATENVLAAAKSYGIRYVVHVSSSVVNSVANDDYTRTKIAQENLVKESGFGFSILRPTLMFGWFDPKHLGWLARFMKTVPIFPIPGDGKFMRQPLYNRDFCRAVAWCMEHQPNGMTYDIVGSEEVDYIDIIRTIREVQRARTALVHIPYGLFHRLLRLYSLFSRQPPFTADQLEALAAGDRFTGVDFQKTFGFRPTPFLNAIRETFTDSRYSGIVLKR
jgi:nucleoside-diphosphate-sugar epimerase